MLKNIWIIINYNLYESKRYFSLKLMEAFTRKGIKTKIIDLGLEHSPPQKSNQRPDLVCSFNRTVADENGLFYWDRYQIPALSFLVDPAIYDLNLLRSPYSLISCVDQFDCRLIQSQAFDRVFFWAHAVERELAAEPKGERPYDVVFLGSSYDPEGLRRSWETRYSAAKRALIDEAVEKTLAEVETPFWVAVQQVVTRLSIELSSTEFVKICSDVDQYVRGVDRLMLIRSIKDAPVHVFGGTCWREQIPIQGWPQSLANQPNVHVHPAISFAESLQIVKQSKICLNSMPFFKEGTHERIFTGLACGSLVITTDNLWIRKHFDVGQDLLTYRSKNWASVNEQVNYYLQHPKEREEMVYRGRQKVMLEHTWDKRVEQLIQFVNPLLKD
jgi:spore maturation protein CgeB